MTDVSTSKTCTICLEEITDSSVSYLPCCHGFHQECFSDYITEKIKSKRNISCPNCRKEHFIYGQRDYEFIMNELGIKYETENTSYEQYIPSGFYSTNINASTNISRLHNTVHNQYQHSIITVPIQGSPRTTNRRRQQTSCNVFWLKYRFYMIALLLIIVIGIVSFLFIFH